MSKTSSVVEIVSSGNASHLDFCCRVKQATISTLFFAICNVWTHSAIWAFVDWFEIDWMMTSFVAWNTVLDKSSTEFREIRSSKALIFLNPGIWLSYYCCRKIWYGSNTELFLIFHHVWADSNCRLARLHICSYKIATQNMNVLLILVIKIGWITLFDLLWPRFYTEKFFTLCVNTQCALLWSVIFLLKLTERWNVLERFSGVKTVPSLMFLAHFYFEW